MKDSKSSTLRNKKDLTIVEDSLPKEEKNQFKSSQSSKVIHAKIASPNQKDKEILVNLIKNQSKKIAEGISRVKDTII